MCAAALPATAPTTAPATAPTTAPTPRGRRYVNLPKYTTWADAFNEVVDLRKLLIGHRTPWDQLGWLTGRTERLWRALGPHAHMQLECGGPPCPGAAQCAHEPTQLACAAEVALPALNRSSPAYAAAVKAVGGRPLAVGCKACECWEGVGPRRASAGGRCNFTRAAMPSLPAQCWRPEAYE